MLMPTFQNEISKAYRKLARKWHPDMHRSSDDKQNAAIMFHQIATAYEVGICHLFDTHTQYTTHSDIHTAPPSLDVPLVVTMGLILNECLCSLIFYMHF